MAARGDIIKQDGSGSDLTAFVVAIDTIESETGLDFLADLDDVAEEELGSVRFATFWGDE